VKVTTKTDHIRKYTLGYTHSLQIKYCNQILKLYQINLKVTDSNPLR